MEKIEKKIRKGSCTACLFAKNGVKTRKAIRHTCGKDDMKPQSTNRNVKY